VEGSIEMHKHVSLLPAVEDVEFADFFVDIRNRIVKTAIDAKRFFFILRIGLDD
jgi:hypothetical protein